MTDNSIRHTPAKPERFLRIHDVIDRLGMGKTSIHQLIKDGEFPEGIVIRARILVWLESDVDQYITQKARSRKRSAAFLNHHSAG